MFRQIRFFSNGALWGFNRMQNGEQLKCEAMSQTRESGLPQILSQGYCSNSRTDTDVID